ncbi:MAG: DUF2752 domain-containing protein [Acidimicrobiia bacterium]
MQATAPVDLDLKRLRIAGAGMLVGALVFSFVSLPSVVLCPLRRVTGVPCPFCGMTRSVTAVARGDLGASLALNPGGIALVVAAIALLLVGWRWRRIAVPTWAVVTFFGLLWAYQLFKYTTGRPL